MTAQSMIYFCAIAAFSMVQGLGNLGCKPFEEDNKCGNLCELTCADAIGNSKPRRSSCYRPLCVCKAYTYRFNGNCVPIDVCERNNGDWKETRPVPPGDISPIPCKDFPCPKGSTCSEGKKICSTKGNCDVTATECLPDGDTSNYDGSGPVATTEVLGTNQPTSCVDFKCNSDQICSMTIGVPRCVPTRMTCNENEEVNPCGNSCELLCADLTNTIPRSCPWNVCGLPACVCKTGFFRLNGNCVTRAGCI